TVITTVAHGLGNGQDPTIWVNGDPSFDAAYNITKINATTFTYDSPGSDVPTTAGAAGDGVSNSAKNPGTPLDVSGSNPISTVAFDEAVTTGTVIGPDLDITGAGGTEIGPLFGFFKVLNPTSGATRTT